MEAGDGGGRGGWRDVLGRGPEWEELRRVEREEYSRRGPEGREQAWHVLSATQGPSVG